MRKCVKKMTEADDKYKCFKQKIEESKQRTLAELDAWKQKRMTEPDEKYKSIKQEIEESKQKILKELDDLKQKFKDDIKNITFEKIKNGFTTPEK